MTKPFQIKYNCPESLSDMPETQCGFYCEMCKKEIFDFRGKSLGDIKAIQAKENVQCGIFDAEIAEEKAVTRLQSIFRFAFAAVFILGFNANMLFGQTKLNYPVVEDTTEEVNTQTVIIRGTVYNHRDKPIKASYSHYLDGANFEVETSEDGSFEIQLPKKLFDTYETYYISFFAEDMETAYIYFQLEDELEYQIDVHMEKYKARNHKHEEYLLGFF